MTLARVLGPLVLLLWASALAQSYYPDQPGMSWTYSGGETQVLSGPREVAGQMVMVLTHYFEGQPISEDYLRYGEEVRGVGTAAGGQQLLYRPELIIYGRAPLQVGQQWTSTTEVAGFSLTLTAEVLGVRGVATSAGRFNAFQIRQTTLTSTGAQTTLDQFFVPGVGVVRFVTQDGTVIDLIEKNF